MKIAIKDIGAVGRRLVADIPVEDLPLVTDLESAERVRFSAPVTVDLILTRQGADAVLAAGIIAARATMPCSRCLEAADVAISTDLRIVFEPLSNAEDAAPGDVVDLTDADMERVPYDGDMLDLGAVIQEEILAAMPLRPLCRQDCKGLCAACGANRNVTVCRCPDANTDPRLAALQNWRQDTDQ